MLKQIENVGKLLSKNEQKAINGGIATCNGLTCSTYAGPKRVTCKEFFALPPEHQCCVLVSFDCFPFWHTTRKCISENSISCWGTIFFVGARIPAITVYIDTWEGIFSKDLLRRQCFINPNRHLRSYIGSYSSKLIFLDFFLKFIFSSENKHLPLQQRN